MDKLNPDDSRAPYVQIADALRAAIANGDFGDPGRKLPSHDAVASQYGVAVGTVKRAFGVLQAERLIVTRQGQGSFVRAPSVEGDSPDESGASESDRLWRAIAEIGDRLTALENQVNGR